MAMAVLVSKSRLRKMKSLKKKNEEALSLKRTNTVLNLKTVTPFYCLSCNFMFSFTIYLYMESSKVAFYHCLSLNYSGVNSVFKADIQ